MILLLFMHIVANYFVVSGFPHLFWPLLGLLFARVRPVPVAKASDESPSRAAGTAGALAAARAR